MEKSDRLRLLYNWKFWARHNQLPPAVGQDGNVWRTWLLLAGRGFGKTRTGAEWVRMLVENRLAGNIALVAPTTGDARDIIVEGPAGIKAISPPWFKPHYEPSKRRISWPNGAVAHLFAAEEPERLRGPNHDAAWADELASWRYTIAWDMLMFGLRLGKNPQVCVTSTPKPIKIVKDLVAAGSTAITRGSSYDNRDNLAVAFFQEIVKKYEGTRLGRQELWAEILEDVVGALWNRQTLDRNRLESLIPINQLKRIVVAIDPTVTFGESGDECGIVVAGVDQRDHGYVLEDASGRMPTEDWARLAISLYVKYKADCIVGEVNNGGDLVQNTIRAIDKNARFKAVRASRGKYVRAEPVAALYEQDRIHHCGMFDRLEDEMCIFTPDIDRTAFGTHFDRTDGLVWALTELLVEDDDGAALEHVKHIGLQACAVDPVQAYTLAKKLRSMGLDFSEVVPYLTPEQALDLGVVAGRA